MYKYLLLTLLITSAYATDLPTVPKPVGNYLSYRTAGKLIFINQIALENGKVKFPGVIGDTVSMEEARLATRITALNVLAVLKEAVGGDLKRVKQAVQLTGYFNAAAGFKDHALLMNEASDMMVQFLGKRGQHARATIGAPTLPMNSSNEIQAVFEKY